MKILFCGTEFPDAPRYLRSFLPGDDIMTCEQGDVARLGLSADVLIPLMHRLERGLIEKTSARLIQQCGVGLEGVDIAAASARGIPVCNVPGDVTPNADSTAEHALFLMLCLARRVKDCFGAFEKGVWGEPLGLALSGRTALIVGPGRVGKALARKLSALGMTVTAVRRTQNPEAEAAAGISSAADLSRLPDMAAAADFVVSTIALSGETRGLLNRDVFRRMKRSAYVVNVSRGPVVDQAGLLEALKAGEIAGAGLDVFTVEPLPPDSPLLGLPNVVATPHIGGVTAQNYEELTRIVAENIARLRDGRALSYCVNQPGLPPA